MTGFTWFPFYVDRFLGSRRTRTMTAEQVGIYLLLLCEQWDHGAVPNTEPEIEDIARAPYSQAIALLQRCFTLTNEGWRNDALEGIRDDQETRSARFAEAGRRGAAKRYGKKRSQPDYSLPIEGLEDSQAIATLYPPYSIREEKTRQEERESVPARTKRKHPLPASWAPKDSHRTKAETEGVDLDREVEKFRDHAAANGRLQIDWDRTFNTWLMHAAEFGHTVPRQPISNGVPTKGGGFYVGG